MKHAISKVYIALFLLLCLLPSLGILIFGESGAAANEILSPRPRWGWEMLSQTGDYLADHFAMRQPMVTLWSRLNAALGRSSDEQVLLGREGWLYYSPSLPDYLGEHLSEEELERIARNLASLQRQCEESGRRFLFTIAPNKNSLYPEHMPAWAVNRHEEANSVRLRPLLEKYGVPYADLFALDLPYYRTDTHWTAEGAARGADAILAALGRESGFAARSFAAQGRHLGDLYEMLYPGTVGAEAAIVDTTGFSHEALGKLNGGNAMNIRTRNAAGEGSLFCWRDSFGIALYPYLAEAYAEAVFSRSTDYRLPEGDWDTLVLEIVERNLPNLLDIPMED